ncbi:MAG: flagellar FlbD family protein [Thermotogaceae bacterium]|nr:flagellar FlbD family protein [Thermotogaceae bacterium]
MIWVTRLNGEKFVINSDHIEIVEANPDTVITLTNGDKYIVKESVDEIIEKVIEFRRKIFADLFRFDKR